MTATAISARLDSIQATVEALKAAIAALTATTDRVHDTRSAAEFVGKSPTTLETMRVKGGGPKFFKLGKSVRYRQSDLVAWLALSPSIASTSAERANA